MDIIKRRSRIIAFTLAVLVALGAGSPAHAYYVYRSVTANPEGLVAWTAANFGVSGQPNPTLSFFHFQDDIAARAGLPNAQCFVRVDLVGVNNPLPGAQSTVGNNAIPVNGAPLDQPRPFPWAIVFDNNPAGHWSIARTEITTATTNAAASRVAAAGFNSLATTDGSNVIVVNGILDNCVAQ